MRNELAPRRFPKVPIQRRVAAFMIDFVAIWLISLAFAGNLALQILVFILGWLGLRVLAVFKNQGQSLGRYALDMKVVDADFGKTPIFVELAKREGITGFVALLTAIGLGNLFTNPISLLLLIAPLAGDFFVAFADSLNQQAFHDRLARTLVVASRRGFSLDLRLKKIVAQASRRMK